MTIQAIIIDSREPEWVQSLTFGDAPSAVTALETGDLQVLTDDGNTLLIERKTPDDFLNTLRDERLFPQLGRMVQARLDEQSTSSTIHTWPYLVITGDLTRGPNGKVTTADRGATGWDWHAVQGALLTVQEMGIFVVFCGGDHDYKPCIERLANRNRGELKLLPPRPPAILGAGAAFLAGLPGIGTERVMAVMEWAGGNVAHALTGLTDLEINSPIPYATRKRIRGMMGLRDKESIELSINNLSDETIDVFEKQTVT